MRTTTIFLTCVLAGSVLAGCGETTETSSTKPPGGEGATRESVAPTENTSNTKIEKQIKRALKSSFSYAPWYDSIGKVTVDNGEVTVATDISGTNFDGGSDSDAEGPANAICTEIYGPGVEPIDGVTGGQVLDSSGDVIKEC